MIYKDFFKEDLLPGGKGDNTLINQLDPQEMALGIAVEQEHSKDYNLAREFASTI